MSCKRCEDIHTAQKDGKTQKECKCDCHNSTTGSLLFNTSVSGTSLTNGNTLSFSDTSSVTGDWVDINGAFAGSTIDFDNGSVWVFGNKHCEICNKDEANCKCTKYKSFMDLPDGKTVPIWRVEHL